MQTHSTITAAETLSSLKLAELTVAKGAVQKIRELVQLIDFVRARPAAARVLEIGSASGGTFWLWCQLAATDATVISLDLPMGQFNNGTAYSEDLLKTYGGAQQQLHFIRKDSHTRTAERAAKKLLKGQPLDVLFIDGDHSYEGVRDDYERYSKYVVKGGLIVFHDVAHHDRVPDCQVERLWQELKQNQSAHHEFIDSEADDRGWGSWGGIGVLVKQ